MADKVRSHSALVQQAVGGSESALAELFEQNRQRLHRMITLRMDPRMRARLDASDVLQETYLELARRLPKYVQEPTIPFFIWLRMIAGNCLTRAHQKHLDTKKRNAKLEVSIASDQVPGVSTVLLASQLAGNFTSVDRGMLNADLQRKFEETLNSMSSSDREILALRHFEELSTEECAHILGMTRSGVLKRHTRALRRLRDAIGERSDLKPLDS